MSMHDYYTVRDDGEPMLPVTGHVFADDNKLIGYVFCSAGLDAFLDSTSLLAACVGYIDNPKQHVVAFEADPTETINPSDHEELAARPLSVRSTTPLRTFLERVAAGGDSAMVLKAEGLLECIETSLLDESGGIEDPEDEFSRGPYDPDPELIELFVLAPHDADMLARPEGPWVDERTLPRGYRAGYFSTLDLLMSDATETAAMTYLPSAPTHVFTVRCEDDMLCFPDEVDFEEPRRLYFRPLELVESLPLPEWFASMEPTNDEATERLTSLLSLRSIKEAG